MGGPKGPMRGPKTHRADQKLNRGERREPEPDYDAKRAEAEERESRHQEQVRTEHPARMTEAGYRSRHGNRR
jgi:hypothetical protein